MIHSATTILLQLRQIGATLCLAESCTGGGLAAAITDIAGCSDVFLQGHVTYANAAKRDTLDIPAAMLDQYGAVSKIVAETMACNVAKQGLMLHDAPCLGLSTTGVAGPESHSAVKPVGTVFIAATYAAQESPQTTTIHKALKLSGSRRDIQQQTIEAALELGQFCLKNL